MIMKTSDNSPKNKKRIVEASGGYYKTGDNSNNKHINSAVTVMPVTKNAQFAGSGANVTMTQPMFFSPLHTAQNWQIASKRRECYQWSFVAPTQITSYEDMSLINIEDFDNNFIDILDGQGNKSIPDKFTKRWVNKKANKIKIGGVAEPLNITNDHNCIVIKNEDIKCEKSKWNRKLCVSKHDSPTCQKLNCDKYKNIEYKISKIKANEVKKGDFVLVPFNIEIKDSIIKTIDEARFAGHLASDGWCCTGKTKSGYRGVSICMHIDEVDYVYPSVNSVFSKLESRDFNLITSSEEKIGVIKATSPKICDFAEKLTKNTGANKKFTKEVVYLKPELQLHVLGAYIQSDGSYNKANECIEITTYSKHLANQLLMMCYRCNILARVNKQPISSSKGTFKTNNVYRYIVNISSSECEKIKEYVPGKMEFSKQKIRRHYKRFFWKNFVVSPVVSNKSYDYEGYVYDIRVPPTFTITANGISIYQCRFFYENEPKIAAGIDFYATFPVNGFKLECKSKKILKYYERIVRKLKLNHWLKLMSHEYFLLGDVFPFIDISCPHCKGVGQLSDGSVCPHKDGTISRILVLNPDWISVEDNILASEPLVVLVPDEELKMIVQKKEPRQIYNRLPPKLIEMVASGRPIPLSNRCVSHLKHNSSPYGKYGTSMLRRCFTVLSYKTKLMTANWIVAERLILPIRVVQIGDEKRPATQEDIQDVANQLAAVANDPNLTLITHHLFKYEFVGATGKIHNITAELEQIGKEILDGLMLNQAILNGEAASYSSAQVGVEIMIRRLDSWRAELAEWVENHIFLPIAMMQGFIDEEESKESGEIKYLHPTIKWNDLQLRDQSNKLQMLMGLHDKKIISTQTLLEYFDLDVDQELQRLREESVMASATGQLGGSMDMGMGGGGMPGGMGGMGGGPPPGGGGMPGGAPGGMPGEMPGGPGGAGGMPGAPMGGAPGGAAPMGGMAGSLPPNLKIGKRGKHGKSIDEQMKAPAPTYIHLTKLEQQMYKMLVNLDVPYRLFGQYKVAVQNNAQPFVLDFAYPDIGVATECLHPETLVPTNRGIKEAKDIVIEDKLIGKNGDLVNIERLINHDYTGNILTIKSFGIDSFKVTENHPILISKVKSIRIPRKNILGKKWTRDYKSFGECKFIKANEIQKGDYLIIPKKRILMEDVIDIDLSKYNGTEPVYNRFILSNKYILNEDFGWLMGIYAAEGSSTKSGTMFSFNVNEIDLISKTQNLLLNIFGLKSKVYINEKEHCARVGCSSLSLSNFFNENFGKLAPNKKLPLWMFNAPFCCKKSFIEAYSAGDGCVREKSKHILRCVSSSRKLLMDIQQLSFSMGYFASFCQSRKEGIISTFIKNNISRSYVTKGLWELDVNFNPKAKTYREDENFYYIPVKNITIEKYSGIVYNFETSGEKDSNHTYLVGNIVTHNCDGAVWHEALDVKAKNQERDRKLANIGWRILRFNEDAIEERMDEVQKVVYQNILEASKERKNKKAETENELIKIACSDNLEKIEEQLIYEVKEMPDNLGKIYLIGV